MKKIKLLLVGYGPRGKIWVKVIKKNTKVILIGVCDKDQNVKNKNLTKIPFFTKMFCGGIEPLFLLKCYSFFAKMFCATASQIF